MKPQLVNLDGGAHNADLHKTADRLMRGATWKKQRVIMIVPSSDMMPAKAALAMASIYAPPNQGFHRMMALGMEVGDAYSTAIEQILAEPNLSQWEYILTLESDNIPPADGLVKLIAQMEAHPEFACIGGLYFCKGPEGCAHIWGDINDPIPNYRPQIPRPDQLIECYGTSMGFNLWRMGMFKDARLRKPWFKTLNGSEGLGVGTQDLYFWADARKYGYRCAVDCGVRVGHLDYNGSFGPIDFIW